MLPKQQQNPEETDRLAKRGLTREDAYERIVRLEAELAARDKAIGESIMFLQKFVAQYELGSALDIPGYIGRVVAKLEVVRDKK